MNSRSQHPASAFYYVTTDHYRRRRRRLHFKCSDVGEITRTVWGIRIVNRTKRSALIGRQRRPFTWKSEG
jgi:hypothetical protein